MSPASRAPSSTALAARSPARASSSSPRSSASSTRSTPAGGTSSQRGGAEQFPVVAFAQRRLLGLAAVGSFSCGLDIAAGPGRGVHEQDPPGRRAGVLPGVWHIARKEGAAAGPTLADLRADLESELA